MPILPDHLRPCHRGLLAVALLGVACSTPAERRVRRDLDRIERALAAPPPTSDGHPAGAGEGAPSAAAGDAAAPSFDGTLPPYLAYAFAHNPSVRAAFERYRAASYDPKIVRRLPDPTLTFSGFIRAVETRVGPQRAKLGVSQWFPWPSQLVQAGHAAALRAEAEGREFEAVALDVARDVTLAYVELWRIDRLAEVERRRIALLEGISASVRGRVEAGRAAVADLARIDTRILQTKDRLAALEADRRAAEAELARALGLDVSQSFPVTQDDLPVGLPAATARKLRADAARNPRVEALAKRSDAERRAAKAERGKRLPSFGIGLDWIVTGDSRSDMPPADSGKDAVIATGMLRLPLWQPSYAAGERKARARARMYDARRRAAEQALGAAVDRTLARLDDAARRVDFYERTLLAQARAALESTRAAYVAERSPLADVLDAEDALFELDRAAIEARAAHARAYADLEALVGHPVPRKEPTP